MYGKRQDDLNSYSSWKRASRKCMEDIRPMCKYVMKESGGKVSSSSPTMFCSWKDIRDANFTRVGCQLHLSKHWINAKEYVLTIPPLQKAKAAAILSQPSSASFITIENTPTVKLLKVLVLIPNRTQKTWSYLHYPIVCHWAQLCLCGCLVANHQVLPPDCKVFKWNRERWSDPRCPWKRQPGP